MTRLPVQGILAVRWTRVAALLTMILRKLSTTNLGNMFVLNMIIMLSSCPMWNPNPYARI